MEDLDSQCNGFYESQICGISLRISSVDARLFQLRLPTVRRFHDAARRPCTRCEPFLHLRRTASLEIQRSWYT